MQNFVKHRVKCIPATKGGEGLSVKHRIAVVLAHRIEPTTRGKELGDRRARDAGPSIVPGLFRCSQSRVVWKSSGVGWRIDRTGINHSSGACGVLHLGEDITNAAKKERLAIGGKPYYRQQFHRIVGNFTGRRAPTPAAAAKARES